MAEQRTQLETYKSASANYQSQLLGVASKDEAIKCAIGAAENLMEALKLCSDPQEKQDLRSQVKAIFEAAECIKKSDQWKPSAQKSPAHTHPVSKKDEIDLWVAAVAESSNDAATNGFPDFGGPRTALPEPDHALVDISDNTAPSRGAASLQPRLKNQHATNTPPPPKKPQVSSDHYPTGIEETGKDDVFSGLVNLQQRQSTRQSAIQPQPTAQVDTSSSSHTLAENSSSALLDASKVKPSPASVETSLPLYSAVSGGSVTAISTTHVRSQVRRLKDPISSRKLAKREEILLLRSSVVNGFKFPPWDKNPATSEFVLQPESALFTDSRELELSAYQHQFFAGWKRAKDALPPPFMYPVDRDGFGPMMGTSGSIDLVQDAATDCSVVASLCAGIARSERGHDKMLSSLVWPFDQNLGRPVISSNGKYIVRLYFNGCWRRVVVDDHLPVSKTHRLLHVIDRRNPALLWPALLEKAYLKVRGGYDFPGSNSCSDLWTLTGWIPEQIYLQDTDTVPDQLWARLYKAFLYGDVLVTLGTGKMTNRQEKELGLEGQHSYVVLDMRETDYDKIFLVKNPWVEGRGWRGPRPSSAPTLDASSSSEHSIAPVEVPNPHPSTFRIGLDHVVQHFESLYLNWNPGLFRYRQDVHFEWTVEDRATPTGCIITHPQFSFFSKEGGVVWLLLCRHFRDTDGQSHDSSDAFNDGTLQPEKHMHTAGNAPKGFMSVFVCDGHGDRIYIKEAYLESSPYVNTPQTLLRWDADADSTYTIVIDQEELSASAYTFSLSAFSNSTIALEPATSKYPRTKTESGLWTAQTAGGTTSSPRYFENPQYFLDVRQRCSLAILLTSVDHRHPLHVKLVFGLGKRMYKLQSRDVLVDSGDHRSGSAFAELQDLAPGKYTIICSLFEAGKTGDYTLRVDSTADVTLKQLPRDGAGLVSMKLSPVCFGPQVHKVAAPVVPRRLASYIVIARFLRATSPRGTHDLGLLGRSPLRLSIELGRGPERKFLITSEEGEYSNSPAVRSESLNLDPTLVNQGDVWLVLDRLSGPGGPVEEWYEVEIFTDMPQACSVGVWREWDD
ncbi:hypothetical protein BCR34DRAFT_563354 [Clohesyomyces aquaticus]|uniref:Calpain catalytic domain-containing protein n=1 Tax=Clohesyomyces aquaticus TaxID=1231657 RepID=A0A1Y1ZRA4_9PLEO|nr:hypothetical protein BCR34DRAFT_563354 [Clohesyomyces aquaticus]